MPHNEPTTDNICALDISYRDQSALITSIFLEHIAIIYEHATQSLIWQTNDVLLDIGSLKKNQLQAVLFINAQTQPAHLCWFVVSYRNLQDHEWLLRLQRGRVVLDDTFKNFYNVLLFNHWFLEQVNTPADPPPENTRLHHIDHSCYRFAK